ncbi:MAG: hypothetical protein QXT73_06940 [Candidatus Methanomethylicaceae archaeon]
MVTNMRRRPQLGHFRYEVRYNLFGSTEYRYRYLHCWICGRVGTVVEVLTESGGLAVRFCSECLQEMVEGVRGAVTDYVREESARRESRG